MLDCAFTKPVITAIALLFLCNHCRDVPKTITVKTVTVKDGVESEEISYVDDQEIAFQLLSLGTADAFIAINQRKNLAWVDGQPNIKMICIIEDSASQRVTVDGFTKAKEFSNREDFLKFMLSKDYRIASESKPENRIFFEKEE